MFLNEWGKRSATRGTILYNSTPQLFAKHVRAAIEAVKNKRNPMIFLKSWNEWAEGNMMEPDLTFGKGYINALREEIDR